MFGLQSLLIIGILAHSELCPVNALPDSGTIGLKFGQTAEDYVRFKPAMEPLKEAYSICAWTKRLVIDRYTRCWLAYATSISYNELILANMGFYNVFGSELHLQDKITDSSDGDWKHQCVTWGSSSQVFRVYHEGDLIGTKETPSGTELGMDGYMVLGNEFDSYGGGFDHTNAFGGELFKANVFNRELTAEEIKEMYSGGLCSDVEEKYGRTRYLKWSDLLLEERSGNVTEIDVGCGAGETRWDVLFLDSFYNKPLTMDLIDTLRSSWDILEDFVGATVTERFIRHFKFYHEHDQVPDIE